MDSNTLHGVPEGVHLGPKNSIVIPSAEYLSQVLTGFFLWNIFLGISYYASFNQYNDTKNDMKIFIHFTLIYESCWNSRSLTGSISIVGYHNWIMKYDSAV